jgi:hypothetical protein
MNFLTYLDSCNLAERRSYLLRALMLTIALCSVMAVSDTIVDVIMRP